LLTKNITHVRIVKNRGDFYVLPVNPSVGSSVKTLPPPPKSFPPVTGNTAPPPSNGREHGKGR
jgi:hypothetical protein